MDQNEADADAAIAAVQADVDQNESDADAAIAAETAARTAADTTLQSNIDAEATTRSAAVAAVQADVDQNESDADAALALKHLWLTRTLPASLRLTPTLAGVRLQPDQAAQRAAWNVNRCRQQHHLNPAAADGRVEVEGEFYLRPSDLTNAADDTAAAAAGVIVGQVYHNNGALRVRLS